MSFAKRALKLSLLLAPVGYLGYNYRHLYYGNIQKKHTFHLNDLSDYFQDYIKQNNLMIPIYYKTYQAKNPFDHFLEKSILHDLTTKSSQIKSNSLQKKKLRDTPKPKFIASL